MGSHLHHDMYYDGSNRSPGSMRHQAQHSTLQRASSRQFDHFGQMPAGLYTAEDHAARYETNRFERPNTSVLPSYGYDIPGAQTWNPNGYGGAGPLAGMGATGRMKAPSRQRSALPTTWLDQQSPLAGTHQFTGMGGPSIGQSGLRSETLNSEVDEELIPTAIVIKNIPFAVKKEQLVQLMTELNLPLPYAFNYHFDNGVFRGLAFANFTTAEETATVIDHMNHFELQGRKLRVEYKKMLPLQERERIEREKRERRGQLEEQHRPVPSSQLHNQPSMSSMSSHVPATSPSPVSMRNSKPDVDLNDPQTLQFYSQLLLFKDDHSREALIFPSTLSPAQRRSVHTLAHHMSLAHVSRGNGDQRQVHIFRAPPTSNNISPTLPQYGSMPNSGDASRRGLNRAATIDFSEARASEPNPYGTMGRSSGMLDVPPSPGSAMTGAGQNLRAAKSFADLRSYTPSPVPSSASFPAALGAGISRFADFGPGNLGSTPNLTPTTTGTALSSTREESLVLNGFGAMSLGSNISLGGNNSRDLRGMMSFERESQQQSFGGPIGSNRSFNMASDDQLRERGQALPLRQPRGPVLERGTGFTRPSQNGHRQRNSGDSPLDLQSVEIVVE